MESCPLRIDLDMFDFVLLVNRRHKKSIPIQTALSQSSHFLSA
ncbi:hypothetical protein LSH36_844g00081 [Paralvinella palmiformis]|uniref:Uncharacterized protein n=1 Tax=Paralvinella palmiformis TaxID=53620 RepID=A0AAD9ISV2_9ANNE|nr:hypothetical protein LSH36_1386g00008 [Paralvinella palmiformis]KAK2143400.1 hypothetical protein LSH36_844g00081 [Paralvinella palmiformis]